MTIVNPDVLQGWGVRPYDWQWGASVQQEILPRTSLEVGYARRWFNNFFVNDNINISAVGLRADDDHRTDQREAARRRRLPGDLSAAEAGRKHGGPEPLHVRQRLR